MPGVQVVSRIGGGLWVLVPSESKVLGWIQRHTVTPGERFEWGAARPRGGDWVAHPTYIASPMTIHRNRDEAARALYDLWLADPDRTAPEVPAP
jgi:hypothetical protein